MQQSLNDQSRALDERARPLSLQAQIDNARLAGSYAVQTRQISVEAANRIQMLEAQMQSIIKTKDNEIAKLHERIKVTEQTSKITVQPTPLVQPVMSASPLMSAFGPQPTSHLRSSVETPSAQTMSHQPTAPLGSSSGVGSSVPDQSVYQQNSFIRNRRTNPTWVKNATHF